MEKMFSELSGNKLPGDLMMEIAQKAKALRRSKKISQAIMAERSGVSLGSLKRFERMGHISLESLLKLAFVLRSLEPFEGLFPMENKPQKLEDLFK
jgi:transcriptional regulator with XRE-family HTH domain